jgi:hypothetical protein
MYVPTILSLGSEKMCPSVTFSTTNPTSPDQESNPGHHGGKPVTNHLSYGTAYGTNKDITKLYIPTYIKAGETAFTSSKIHVV